MRSLQPPNRSRSPRRAHHRHHSPLNEATRITATVANVRVCLPAAEILVVDGGSTDTTCALAAQAGARVIAGPAGRGRQCARGADAALGDLLLFLHADTTLPAAAAAVLRAWSRGPDAKIATFRLRFDRAGWFLRTCARLTRFDSVFTRFGDQGIVARRDFYRQLGGFPPWPLFEDVELLRRARRQTRIISLPVAVTTSARRFECHGTLRQQGRNAVLLMRFLAGASPEALAADYRATATGERVSAKELPAPLS